MIRTRLLRGAASNVLGKLVAAATSLLLTPFLLHALGPDAYGLWTLAGALFAYGALLDLGIGGAVVKYVAEHAARGEMDAASATVGAAMRIYAGIAVCVAAAAALLAPYAAGWLDLPAGAREAVRWLVFLTGLNAAASIALLPMAAALQGLQRYSLYNLVVIAGTFVSAGATVLAVQAGGGVVGLAGIALCVTVVTRVGHGWMVRRTAPALRFGPGGASPAATRKVASFSVAAFVTQLGWRLGTRTDELVIAAFLPLGAIASYAVARRMTEVAQMLADQFLKLALPLASELDARGDQARLRALYTHTTRLALAIVVPAAVVLHRYAAPILEAWVGPAYASAAGVVTILAVAGAIDGSQWGAMAMLQGMNRHRLLAVTSLCSGVANVALSAALVRPLGLEGVAWGTLIPTATASFGVIVPLMLRALRIRPAEALRDTFLPGLLPALPMMAACAAVERILPADGLVPALGAACGGGLAYLAAYLAMPAARPERELARSLAARTLRFAARADAR